MISLVTDSVTVEFSDEDKVGEVVEAIEDVGFEATVDTLINLDEEGRRPRRELSRFSSRVYAVNIVQIGWQGVSLALDDNSRSSVNQLRRARL